MSRLLVIDNCDLCDSIIQRENCIWCAKENQEIPQSVLVPTWCPLPKAEGHLVSEEDKTGIETIEMWIINNLTPEQISELNYTPIMFYSICEVKD